MKQQVKNDTFQEEDDQQVEEGKQAATTILESVEPEVQEDELQQINQMEWKDSEST